LGTKEYMRAVKNTAKSELKLPIGVKEENQVEMGYGEVWRGWLAPGRLERKGIRALQELSVRCRSRRSVQKPGGRDGRLTKLPANVGNVEGIADGRSMVYVTGVSDEPQTLIFIAFLDMIR